MGRCRRCGCTEYDCGFWQRMFILEPTTVFPIRFGKANQNLCTCGHQRNDHY